MRGSLGEWKALLLLQTLRSFSRRGCPAWVPAGLGPGGRALDAPPGAQMRRRRLGARGGVGRGPRPPEASSRRWGVCGGNWLNQLRSGASPPARRPVGPEGAFLRQRRLRGGGRGEGRPGGGAWGRIPPLPQTGAGPEFGRYPPHASRNEGGPVRAGPWPEDGRGERQGAFRSPRAEPGGELSVGATLGRQGDPGNRNCREGSVETWEESGECRPAARRPLPLPSQSGRCVLGGGASGAVNVPRCQPSLGGDSRSPCFQSSPECSLRAHWF